MQAKKVIPLILCYSLIHLMICCKKENQVIEKAIQQKSSAISYKIDFPDTLFVNQLQDGVIYYKSSLDSIITTFGNKRKNRYTRFILTTTDNVNYNYRDLKMKVKDTFGALNNREIPFYNIKFSKAGVYYIDGVINDIVLLDTFTNTKSKNDRLELIEKNERVTHKIVVIEKGNVYSIKTK